MKKSSQASAGSEKPLPIRAAKNSGKSEGGRLQVSDINVGKSRSQEDVLGGPYGVLLYGKWAFLGVSCPSQC